MSHRKEKLEEQIRRMISDLLIKEVKDPRIGFATVSDVRLSKDSSSAMIGISVLGDAREIRKTFEGIKSSTGYLQHRLIKALHIRSVPRIEFYLDSSISESVKMVDLLNKLEDDEKKIHPEDEKDPADGK